MKTVANRHFFLYVEEENFGGCVQKQGIQEDERRAGDTSQFSPVISTVPCVNELGKANDGAALPAS